MKSRNLFLTLVTAMFSVSANAQNNAVALVDVPFEFSVGSKKMAAGSYQVDHVNQVIRIGTRTDSAASIISAWKSKPGTSTDPLLVFSRYGDQYFLSEIWPAGVRNGMLLPKTSLERELAARVQSPMNTVVIARKR